MVAKSCASLLLLGRLAAGVSLAWVPGLALAQPPAVAAATPAPAAGDPGLPASKPAAVVDEEPLRIEPRELKGGSVADGVSEAWAMMVKALVALAAVVMLAYLILGKGLGKLAARQSMGKSIQVVDRVGLDPRRTVYLLDVEGVRTLVVSGENAIAVTVLPKPVAADFASVLREKTRPPAPSPEGAPASQPPAGATNPDDKGSVG